MIRRNAEELQTYTQDLLKWQVEQSAADQRRRQAAATPDSSRVRPGMDPLTSSHGVNQLMPPMRHAHPSPGCVPYQDLWPTYSHAWMSCCICRGCIEGIPSKDKGQVHDTPAGTHRWHLFC